MRTTPVGVSGAGSNPVECGELKPSKTYHMIKSIFCTDSGVDQHNQEQHKMDNTVDHYQFKSKVGNILVKETTCVSTFILMSRCHLTRHLHFFFDTPKKITVLSVFFFERVFFRIASVFLIVKLTDYEVLYQPTVDKYRLLITSC
jgi:hypothetical protein